MAATPQSKIAWYSPYLRIVIWLSLAAAQIIDFILVQNAVMKITQLWYDDAVQKLAIADPKASTTQLDFAVKAVYFLTFMILGILLVSIAIWMDEYFKRGEKKKILMKRVAKVAGAEVVVALVAIIAITLLRMVG